MSTKFAPTATVVDGTTVTYTVDGVGSRSYTVREDGTVGRYCGYCTNGYISAFAHIDNGLCYRCEGKPFDRYADTVEQGAAKARTAILAAARRDAKRAKEQSAKQAEKDAALAVWRTANPEAAAIADAINAEYDTATQAAEDQGWSGYDAAAVARGTTADAWGNIIIDLALTAGDRGLTEAQTTLLVKAHGEKVAAAQAQADEAAASRWVGDVKERITFTGVVARSIHIDSHDHLGRPQSKRLVVLDGTGEHAGAHFKFTGTSMVLWDLEPGQTYTVTGTVKSHDDYEGVKQTVCLRPKVA